MVAVLLRQLTMLYAASVPLHRSLEVLPCTASAEWRDDVLAGRSLSEAMSRQPGPLTPFHIQVVRLGENVGRLDECLKRLADSEERLHGQIRKIRSQLVYPGFLLLLSVLVIAVLPGTVLKGVLGFLAAHESLPLPTRILLWWSALIRHPASYAALGLACAAGLRLKRDPRLLLWLDHLPWVSPVLRTLGCLRFAEAFALCQESGAPVLYSLRLAGNCSGHPVLQARLGLLQRNLLNGMSLPEAFASIEFFPKSFILAMAVDCESGSAGKAVKGLLRLIEMELESRVNAVVSLLEPLALLCLGIFTGFVVIATALPLSRLAEVL